MFRLSAGGNPPVRLYFSCQIAPAAKTSAALPALPHTPKNRFVFAPLAAGIGARLRPESNFPGNKPPACVYIPK
jgi:hypothetical protein